MKFRILRAIITNTSPNTPISSTKTASIIDAVRIRPPVFDSMDIPEAQTEPWKIEEAHALTKACVAAYKKAFGQQPPAFTYWDFSTNAVATVPVGIPTIGFGPGDPGMAHMKNECCETVQIFDAYRFYLALIAGF